MFIVTLIKYRGWNPIFRVIYDLYRKYTHMNQFGPDPRDKLSG